MPYRTIRIEVAPAITMEDVSRSRRLYYKGEFIPSEVKGIYYQGPGITHTATIEGVTVFHRYGNKHGFFEIGSDGKEKPLRPEMLQYIECR